MTTSHLKIVVSATEKSV